MAMVNGGMGAAMGAGAAAEVAARCPLPYAGDSVAGTHFVHTVTRAVDSGDTTDEDKDEDVDHGTRTARGTRGARSARLSRPIRDNLTIYGGDTGTSEFGALDAMVKAAEVAVHATRGGAEARKRKYEADVAAPLNEGDDTAPSTEGDGKEEHASTAPMTAAAAAARAVTAAAAAAVAAASDPYIGDAMRPSLTFDSYVPALARPMTHDSYLTTLGQSVPSELIDGEKYASLDALEGDFGFPIAWDSAAARTTSSADVFVEAGAVPVASPVFKRARASASVDDDALDATQTSADIARVHAMNALARQQQAVNVAEVDAFMILTRQEKSTRARQREHDTALRALARNEEALRACEDRTRACADKQPVVHETYIALQAAEGKRSTRVAVCRATVARRAARVVRAENATVARNHEYELARAGADDVRADLVAFVLANFQ